MHGQQNIKKKSLFKIVLYSIWYHHTCRWPSRAHVHSQPAHRTATYRCDDTRCCIIQFWPPDDERIVLETCRGIPYTYYKTRFCALSWLITKLISCVLTADISSLIEFTDVTKPIVVFPQFCDRASECWRSSRRWLNTDCQYNVWFIRLQWLPFCVTASGNQLHAHLKWRRKSRKLIDAALHPSPEGRIQAMEEKQTHQRCESWKYVRALYLGWTVALVLTIERWATAWQVNKPIQDMGTLTAERTMGSGYTRGRLPYLQLRYSWRLQASGMWRRVPCYRKTQRHSPPNEQTFSVTAEITRKPPQDICGLRLPQPAPARQQKNTMFVKRHPVRAPSQIVGRLRLKRDGTRCRKPDFVSRRNGRVHLNRRWTSIQSNYWQPRCAHQR